MTKNPFRYFKGIVKGTGLEAVNPGI